MREYYPEGPPHFKSFPHTPSGASAAGRSGLAEANHLRVSEKALDKTAPTDENDGKISSTVYLCNF